MVNTKPAFNPYAAYAVNEDAETDGIWLVEPFFRIRTARAGGRNTGYQKRYDALTKPYKRAIQTGTLDKETDEDLSRKLYSTAVIKNWSVPANIDDKGKPVRGEDGEIVWKDGFIHDPETFEVVPVTPELIERTFRMNRELFNYVIGQANDVSLFKDEDAEAEDVKN